MPNARAGRRSSSDALWRRTFGADPAIVGKQIDVQGRKRTVVGVAPPGSRSPRHPCRRSGCRSVSTRRIGAIAASTISTSSAGSSRTSCPRRPNAELRYARAPVGDAQSRERTSPNDTTHRLQFASLAGGSRRQRHARAVDASGRGDARAAHRVRERRQPSARARRGSRHKEFAVRTALGAGRGRILRQFIAEGLVLTTLGAILGSRSRTGDSRHCSRQIRRAFRARRRSRSIRGWCCSRWSSPCSRRRSSDWRRCCISAKASSPPAIKEGGTRTHAERRAPSRPSRARRR